MPRVVKPMGGALGARFVILQLDSSQTAAMVVPYHAYVPGKEIENYDHEDLAQLDLDGLLEVQPPHDGI